MFCWCFSGPGDRSSTPFSTDQVFVLLHFRGWLCFSFAWLCFSCSLFVFSYSWPLTCSRTSQSASDTSRCELVWCNAMRCDAMPCHAMPCHAMPCHAILCEAMRCDATRRDATQLDAMQCGVMWCILYNVWCLIWCDMRLWCDMPCMAHDVRFVVCNIL